MFILFFLSAIRTFANVIQSRVIKRLAATDAKGFIVGSGFGAETVHSHDIIILTSGCIISVRWQFEARVCEAQFFRDYRFSLFTQVAVAVSQVDRARGTFAGRSFGGVASQRVERVAEADFGVVRKQEWSFTLAT